MKFIILFIVLVVFYILFQQTRLFEHLSSKCSTPKNKYGNENLIVIGPSGTIVSNDYCGSQDNCKFLYVDNILTVVNTSTTTDMDYDIFLDSKLTDNHSSKKIRKWFEKYTSDGIFSVPPKSSKNIKLSFYGTYKFQFKDRLGGGETAKSFFIKV